MGQHAHVPTKQLAELRSRTCCSCVQEPIPTSLLRLAPDHVNRAVKMFAGAATHAS